MLQAKGLNSRALYNSMAKNAQYTQGRAVSSSNPNRKELVDKLASDRKYTHAVAGNFGVGNSHAIYDVKGPLKGNSIFEGFYALTCGYELVEPDGPEFKAKVWSRDSEDFPDDWMFHLAYPDRQGQDKRDGVHTSYTAVVPKSEAESVKAAVAEDPSILIDVFRRVFGDCDRSKGALSIAQD